MGTGSAKIDGDEQKCGAQAHGLWERCQQLRVYPLRICDWTDGFYWVDRIVLAFPWTPVQSSFTLRHLRNCVNLERWNDGTRLLVRCSWALSEGNRKHSERNLIFKDNSYKFYIQSFVIVLQKLSHKRRNCFVMASVFIYSPNASSWPISYCESQT